MKMNSAGRRVALALTFGLLGIASAHAAPMRNPHGSGVADCALCHAPESWAYRAGGFAHAASGFPHSGGHAALLCRDCHEELEFARVASGCADCHDDAHGGRLGFRCLDCHTPDGWSAGGDFTSLHAERGFPLMGVHAVLDCEVCHRGDSSVEFAGAPSECFFCHEAEYMESSAPDHEAAGFSTRCENCHSPVGAGWGGRNFNHAWFYPLVGEHALVQCVACHRDGFAGTTRVCLDCHADDLVQANEPDHAALGFTDDCGGCHSPAAWRPASFDHGLTAFPLQGSHRQASCSDCHGGGLVDPPQDCLACHEPDLASTDDPDHAELGLTDACEACHDASAWSPSGFDHAATDFALLGAHTAAACADCHGGGSTAADRACFACHEGNLADATDPDHIAGGFPPECEACHNQAAWSPADFDHTLSDFPLLGAHVSAACVSCHAGGYSGTPRECGICHADDYAATNDPPHAAAGFNDQCDACHGNDAWRPANWDHDPLFPIYTGRHREEWNLCADCHVAPANYSVFECIFCHAHGQSEADGEHDEVSGYVYASWACYDCHPRGEAGD